MKFGHTLVAQQVPEWQGRYLDYKQLKQIIKRLTRAENAENAKTIQAMFLYTLDENVSKVDTFYATKLLNYEARLLKITNGLPDFNSISNQECDDITQVLVELRSSIRHLKWFAELNKRGVYKIMKKLDKKTGSSLQKSYVDTKLQPTLFAQESTILKLLTQTNDLLAQLDDHINNNVDNIVGEGDSHVFISAIEDDSAETLEKLLAEQFTSPVLTPLKTLLKLLNESTMQCRTHCMDFLLEMIPVLGLNGDITGKNFIHHYVISLGKKCTQQQPLNDGLAGTKGFVHLLNNLPMHLKYSIVQRDSTSRTPLHYAANYGLEITLDIIKYLKKWDLIAGGNDGFQWEDGEGMTPLHLAIIGNYYETVDCLLEEFKLEDGNMISDGLLTLTNRLSNSRILELLLDKSKLDVNKPDEVTNETPLYLASKLNLSDCVQCLLNHNADTEIREKTFGWTPIFVAASNGYTPIVNLLLAHGAKLIEDFSGWLPREHAGLRGFVDLIDLLTPVGYDAYAGIPKMNITPPVTPESTSMENVISNKTSFVADPKNLNKNYLSKGQSMVLLNIGTMDTRDKSPAVTFNHELIGELGMSLRVRSSMSDAEYCLELPLDDNHGIASDSLNFKLSSGNARDMVLYFDIEPSFNNVNNNSDDSRCIGRAIGQLSSLMPQVGLNKRTLFTTVTLPILSITNLDIIGNIKFQFNIIESFESTYPNNIIPSIRRPLKSNNGKPTVIGHRGNGMNQNVASLQLGENTVQSFIKAAELGASYVEFDVQLTKDGIPVIYHDFTIAETGLDIPMQELTLEQFLALSDNNSPGTKRKDELKSDNGEKERKKSPVKDDYYIPSSIKSSDKSTHEFSKNSKIYSMDVNSSEERMKYTKTWKNKLFKANTRGKFIAAGFTTLEELFQKIPTDTGFNMELKYPMLDESELDDIGQIAYEMNYFCDTILDMVYRLGVGRDVVFSSFHPDICQMMTMKQQIYPVLFLTEAGTTFMADVRASSLQNGIRFAKQCNLFGIVSEATVVVKCPRLIQVVKDSGLACFTYGTANNDPVTARKEIESGVDAVIVDSVLAVSKGFSGV